MPNSHFGLYVV